MAAYGTKSVTVPPQRIPYHGYVEVNAPQGTTSAVFVDVPGSVLNIVLTEPQYIAIVSSFEMATQSGASASIIELCVNIDGVDHDDSSRYLSGSNDVGLGPITHCSDAPLAAGAHVVKMRFRRATGVSTPGVNRIDLLALGLLN